MPKDSHGFDLRCKYKVGAVLRHKKHGYIVRVNGRSTYYSNRRLIELLRGPVPNNSYIFSTYDNIGDVSDIAACTLNSQFEYLGPAAEVLFG